MKLSIPKRPTTPRPGEGFSLRPVIAAFALITAAFIAATVYGEIRSSTIDSEAAGVEENGLPSVEHLAAARAALWRLDRAVDQFDDVSTEGRADAFVAMAGARKDIDRQLEAELATEMYPGEQAVAALSLRALDELDGLVVRLREVNLHDRAEGRLFAEHDVREGIDHVDAALDRLFEVNTRGAHAEIRRIAKTRSGSVFYAFALELGSVGIAIVGAMVAITSLRRQREVELAHQELLRTRAEELDLFATRVAHDMLSPLSALSFALSSVGRSLDRGDSTDEPMERARMCLTRSQRLVHGVLDFARSGAQPREGERANLREALDGVFDEVRTESMGAELTIEPFDDPLFVACAPAILTSVLANLLLNAVKYMGERRERRVGVRVTPSPATVRVDVEDTGPGLAAELEREVFEPYVRGDNARPGLGLGLATVRRFVESHRGRVGVHSYPDRGCVFWFELPRVTTGIPGGLGENRSKPHEGESAGTTVHDFLRLPTEA